MFQSRHKPQTGFGRALAMFEVIYHSMVRAVRQQHYNAFMALGINIMQMVIFIGVFFAMFEIMGMRGAAIRGDFLLYLMSGIFLYITHVKALGAVVGSEGPASPMMQHAPMNTIVSILAAAFGALYMQTLTVFVILFIYHVAWTPFVIDDPLGAYGMLLMSWFTGFALGLVLLAVKPWYPSVVNIFQQLYQRANMIASGKMFVANTLPGFMIAMFDWNPLFHCIDQARGYIFINYSPLHSSISYPLLLSVVLIMVGLMGEFYTRKHASSSWDARR